MCNPNLFLKCARGPCWAAPAYGVVSHSSCFVLFSYFVCKFSFAHGHSLCGSASTVGCSSIPVTCSCSLFQFSWCSQCIAALAYEETFRSVVKLNTSVGFLMVFAVRSGASTFGTLPFSCRISFRGCLSIRLVSGSVSGFGLSFHF